MDGGPRGVVPRGGPPVNEREGSDMHGMLVKVDRKSTSLFCARASGARPLEPPTAPRQRTPPGFRDSDGGNVPGDSRHARLLQVEEVDLIQARLQDNSLLRSLLVEATQVTVRCDPDWRRQFLHLAMRGERRIAKVAMARKLACDKCVSLASVMIKRSRPAPSKHY